MDNLAARVLSPACSEALGRSLSPAELITMVKYLDLLLKWQRSQRLVASADPTWIARTLLADSLLFVRLLPEDAERIVDVGSGAGFPGVPIKIVRPRLSVTLLESRQRRASFLKAVVRELELTGIDVIDRRLEAVAGELAERFDAAVMRCAGDPGHLLPLVLPLLRAGGRVVVAGAPPQARAQGRPTRPAVEARSRGFESVVVPGVEGRPRQFLVAQKS